MSFRFLKFSKKPTKSFDKFLPQNLKSGKIIKLQKDIVFEHFLDSGAEIWQILRWFFGKFKKSNRHSEFE